MIYTGNSLGHGISTCAVAHIRSVSLLASAGGLILLNNPERKRGVGTSNFLRAYIRNVVNQFNTTITRFSLFQLFQKFYLIRNSLRENSLLIPRITFNSIQTIMILCLYLTTYERSYVRTSSVLNRHCSWGLSGFILTVFESLKTSNPAARSPASAAPW